MASSSSAKNLQSAPGSSSTVEQYEEPIRTFLTPNDSLEVFCELIIDFKSLKENRFDLSADVTAQGWNMYFDFLLGPMFPIMVKELWVHATSSNHQVTPYVLGKKIVIIEDLI